MSDLFETAKAITEGSRVAFEAGHKAGYALGFKEGAEHAIKKVMEVINSTSTKVVTP